MKRPEGITNSTAIPTALSYITELDAVRSAKNY